MAKNTAQNACKVSVLIVSYNHEKFIGEAIESVLAQQVDFPLEIVVADDCSSDSTISVVKQYQALADGQMVLLGSDTNVGVTRNYQRGFAACSGEYIAVLEGDDYWLGKDRLRTMVDFLDEHPECAMAFNRILFLDSSVPSCRPLQWDSPRSFELKAGAELALQNFIGNFSACIYRSEAVQKQDASLYDQKMYDWLFNLSLSRFGLIGYIPSILSVYRQHNSGTWSSMSLEKKLLETLEVIPVYNDCLHHVYAPQFHAHQRELQLQVEIARQQEMLEKHKGNLAVKLYILFLKVLRRIRLKVLSIIHR